VFVSFPFYRWVTVKWIPLMLKRTIENVGNKGYRLFWLPRMDGSWNIMALISRSSRR